MKNKVLRTAVFIALLSLLQPVTVSASEIIQLTQVNQTEQIALTEANSEITARNAEETTEIPVESAPEPEFNQDNSSEVPEETESSELTEPTEPTKPVESTEPTSSTESSSSTESTESSSTSTGESSTETSSSSQPVEETKPTEPAKPTEPTKPTKPVEPTKPSQPVTPKPPVAQPQPAPSQPTEPDFNWPTYSEGEAVGPILSTTETSFTFNHTTDEFIKKIGPLASKIANSNDLYASVMIAQAILESGSGNSSLAGIPNYNIFGIKGAYKGKFVAMPTQEDRGDGSMYSITASFRRYPSYKESLEDYAKLLNKGITGNEHFYQGAWKSKTKNYQEATAFLTGKYATDTLYASKLNGLIKTYNLTKYDKYDKNMEKSIKALSMGPDSDKLVAEATQFLGLPYVWGGTTPEGFDCSGLVQYVYKKAANIELPRVTWQQELIGEDVSFKELKTGDLLFFGPRGATHHVGMYLDNGLFIHAPQTGDVVKITSMDEFKPDFAKRVAK